MTTQQIASQMEARIRSLNPRQQRDARELIACRDSAAADLKGACSDPQWRADRVAEIARCNRNLERLGVIPAL